MILLTNDTLARALHNTLYQRMLSFCQVYTPEFPGDVIVQHWLTRLYSSDPTLHLLVHLDSKYNVVAHCVVDVQTVSGCHVVFVHQAQVDRGYSAIFDEGMEYIDKLAQQINATCVSLNVAKNSKVYEKKYGYTTVRSVMIKQVGDMSEADSIADGGIEDG